MSVADRYWRRSSVESSCRRPTSKSGIRRPRHQDCIQLSVKVRDAANNFCHSAPVTVTVGEGVPAGIPTRLRRNTKYCWWSSNCMYAEEVDDMRRMFGVRHLRYYYWRLRVERQALRYYLTRGEGLRPGEGQMRALLAIWYGEC